MGCATRRWSSAGTQDQSNLRVSVSVLSLLACRFYSSSSPRHSSRRLSYLRHHGGGGTGAYLWRVIGLDWSVVHDGNHSMFSVQWFLKQRHNWSLWGGYIPLQWHTSSDSLRENSKGTYHHWRATTRIQGSILGGKAAEWFMELQHGNKISTRFISCLDESTMKWINKYTCPGFMFVPCKPW